MAAHRPTARTANVFRMERSSKEWKDVVRWCYSRDRSGGGKRPRTGHPESRLTSSKKVDYGLDAPGIVRNLVFVAATGLILFLSAAIGLWSGVIVGIPLAG